MFRFSHRLEHQDIRMFTIVLIAILYAVFLSFFSIRAHLGLQTQMNDLGNADQAIWAASEGDWSMPQSNNLDGQIHSRLGMHANLLFLPLSLLYHLWPDPRILLILSSMACSLGSIGLYKIASHRLGPIGWSLVPPLAFLCSPLVHTANLYDFHIITIATAFIIWAIYSFWIGNNIRAWIFLIFALLCKEDIPLITAMYGIITLMYGNRRRGIIIIVISLLYLIAVLGLLVPVMNKGEWTSNINGANDRYSWIIRTPGKILPTIARPDRLRLLLYFLLSGAIAAWKGRRWLLLLIPSIFYGLFSDMVWMTRLTGTYYWITAEAVIIIACLEASRGSLTAMKKSRPWPLIYLSTATILFSFLFSPLPHGVWASWDNYKVDDAYRSLEEIQKRIPIDGTLSVQNNLGAHLSHRPDIATIPRRSAKASHILIHLRYLGGPVSGLFVRTSPSFMYGLSLPQLLEVTQRLIQSPDWGIVEYCDGFYLFERNAEDRLDETEILDRFRSDSSNMVESYRSQSNNLSPLRPYIVSSLTWKQLFHPEFLK
ncbi:MAG: DUF2079 domain-containing protein [Candidatus Eisenbacteria bacterium]|uniref:DUF2079 domain-containing protein n=1 Tax=Eiseniibacteriota bacterium TaxID=2212470 RepID=A0A948RZK4_UNCEI|nr:DUF2079 domain-containing protein [Candidatus Eisenbacteria bacterium]MBU1951103.1 DUF2079 domain-containing protein [Candidatus Eisenbacteria bacterium]MBU2692489.1 DUF2079 domain-containing protein [Candidatus Eisenbacteria bacterium]